MPARPTNPRARLITNSPGYNENSDFASLGGGDRVRLCNPCVPDPNVAPPQTPQLDNRQTLPGQSSYHSRSQSSAINSHGGPSQLQSQAGLQSNPRNVTNRRKTFELWRSVTQNNSNSRSSQERQLPNERHDRPQAEDFYGPLDQRNLSTGQEYNPRSRSSTVSSLAI
jgi:hypothetical protein